MKKCLLLVVVSWLLVISVAGCSRGQKALQIKGSDTMVNLAQSWVEEFMSEYPNLAVAVTGGGSGTGIAALLSNTTDIALASREIKKKEIAIAEKRNIHPLELHVANDGIVVVVNPSNPVKNLSIGQLSDIFTGKTKNWKEVGGKDSRIVVLSRERNSGTHVFFLEEVVKQGKKKSPNEFAPSVLMMPSSQAIVEEINGNSAAIGYFGLGYLTNKQKAVAVEGILPTVKTVTSGKYPISRSLLFYTNGKPGEKVKPFIDFVLSPKGQEIVLKMDFVPIK